MKPLISRKELYDLVWSEPLSILAKRFEISDVRLGKICIEANIPKPGVGYWAKRQAGKASVKPALPDRKLGQAEYLVFREYQDWGTKAEEERLLSEPAPPKPEFSEDINQIARHAQELTKNISIRKTISNPHPAIAKLLAKDNERKEKQLSNTFGHFLNPPLYDSQLGRRRLRILNSLFMGFDNCGCKTSAFRSEAKELNVRIGDQSISFELNVEEKKHERAHLRTSTEEEKLSIKISWWNAPSDLILQWQDSSDLSLEEQIKDILTGFLIAGERMYRAQILYRHELLMERREDLKEKIRLQKEKAIQLEQEQLQKIREEKRQQLFSDVSNWRQASEIRAYVEAVLMQSQKSTSRQDDLHLKDWASWAWEEANKIDPLSSPEK